MTERTSIDFSTESGSRYSLKGFSTDGENDSTRLVGRVNSHGQTDMIGENVICVNTSELKVGGTALLMVLMEDPSETTYALTTPIASIRQSVTVENFVLPPLKPTILALACIEC